MEHKKVTVAVFILLLLATGLRLYHLTNDSLWWDEGLSLTNSDFRQPGSIFTTVRTINDADRFQPLYFFILSAWRFIAGDAEWTIRILSVFFGVGAVFLVFLIAYSLYGRRHALWSMFLVGVSSFCVYYSQEVRNYALQFFLAALVFYLFSPVLKNRERFFGTAGKWYFGIASAVALFGGISFVCFLGSLAAIHLLFFGFRKNFVSWWLPAALCSIPVLIYFYTLPGAVNPEMVKISRAHFPLLYNALFTLYGIAVGITCGPPMEFIRDSGMIRMVLRYLPIYFILLLSVIGIGIALLPVMRFRKRDEDHVYTPGLTTGVLVALIGISFLFSMIFASVTKMNWVARHSYFLWVPLGLVLPAAFIRTREDIHEGKGRVILGMLSFFLLLVLNGYSLYHYYFDPCYRRDDCRSTARYLVAHRTASVPSIYLRGSVSVLAYYKDSSTIEYSGITGVPAAERVNSLADNADTVLIVVEREHALGGQKVIEDSLRTLYRGEVVTTFPSIKIYRFVKNRTDVHPDDTVYSGRL